MVYRRFLLPVLLHTGQVWARRLFFRSQMVTTRTFHFSARAASIFSFCFEKFFCRVDERRAVPTSCYKFAYRNARSGKSTVNYDRRRWYMKSVGRKKMIRSLHIDTTYRGNEYTFVSRVNIKFNRFDLVIVNPGL